MLRNLQFGFVTTSITNQVFHKRVVNLFKAFLLGTKNTEQAGSIPDPVVPPLTIEDTTLFPGTYTSGLVAYASPWIDLCSPNHVVSSISRQVLNLEVSYANFCGVRSIIVPGPKHDVAKVGNGQGITQYARAIKEAFSIGTRVNIMIHLPMYREPGLEDKVELLSSGEDASEATLGGQDIDLFSTWDSWHTIRSVCEYDSRLFVGKYFPFTIAPGRETIDSYIQRQHSLKITLVTNKRNLQLLKSLGSSRRKNFRQDGSLNLFST